MKALTYGGPGVRAWETVPDPAVQEPTDLVVEIGSSTICGTDLHILKGDVPTVEPGRILGHEAVGIVVEAGSAVTTVTEGDRVLVSCITACGRCRFCREGHYGLCSGGGGWILGHLIDGLQAEYARVPFGDTSVYPVPEALTDEQVLFLADILPTAYEVGVLNGGVQPGDTVAIVGAVVDHDVRPELERLLEAARGQVDRDDPPGRVELRRHDRREADRACTDDREGVARLDAGVQHAALVRRRQDVREEQHLLVR